MRNIKVEMFPDGMIALNKELASGFHPRLAELLARHKADDWQMKLAEISVYCEVILDDTYDVRDLGKIAGILAKKLYNKRQSLAPQIIVPWTH